MTALELHIDFNTKFQKVNSNRYRSFEPEEIDWLLNDTTLKLLDETLYPEPQTRVSTGKRFQDTKPRYDDFQELVTTEKLKTYVAPVELDGYANDAVFAILPANYYKQIDDLSKTVYKCNGISKTQVVSNLYVTKVTFVNDTTNAPTELYKNLRFTIVRNGGTVNNLVFNLDDYTPYINGIGSDNELKFIVLNLILEEINRQAIDSVRVYWETFYNVYTPNTFIFVSTEPMDSVIMNLNGGITTATTTLALTHIGTGEDGKFYSNRLSSREEIRNLLNYAFGSTKYNSPLSNLQRGHLIVYTNDTFNVEEVILEYIRRPRKVNLALGRTSELVGIHEKIVDTAVERVAALLQAGNLQGLVWNNQELKKHN